MKQKEKLKTMTTAMESHIRQQATGHFKEKTVKTQVDKEQVEKSIEQWPDSSGGTKFLIIFLPNFLYEAF